MSDVLENRFSRLACRSSAHLPRVSHGVCGAPIVCIFALGLLCCGRSGS